MKKYLLVIITLSGCISNILSHQDIQYIGLYDYKFQAATINLNKKIQLIAFSGGPESDKDHTYYYQFIGIAEGTRDTIRILCPLINFRLPYPDTTSVNISPNLFDASKGETRATFKELDTAALNLFKSMNANPDNDKPENIFKVKVTAKDFVIINKSIDLFSNPTYKTRIGELHFDRQPY